MKYEYDQSRQDAVIMQNGCTVGKIGNKNMTAPKYGLNKSMESIANYFLA